MTRDLSFRVLWGGLEELSRGVSPAVSLDATAPPTAASESCRKLWKGPTLGLRTPFNEHPGSHLTPTAEASLRRGMLL